MSSKLVTLKIPIEGKDPNLKIFRTLERGGFAPRYEGRVVTHFENPEVLTRGAELMTSSEFECLGNDDDRSPKCCAISNLPPASRSA